MIKLNRSRDPDNIAPSFKFDKQVERLVGLMKQHREKLQAGESPPKLKIDPKWSVTKEQLLKETNQKCAHCESHTTAVAFGDVEHYRPKSKYWWLAYVYDNYLASCSICNRQFKSDNFKVKGKKMCAPIIRRNTTDDQIEILANQFALDPLDENAIADFEDMHRAESPLIPNPYVDDPEPIFKWVVLPDIKEVTLEPNPNNQDSKDIVVACERLYGLNRPQLKRRRYQQWREYQFSVKVMESKESDQELRDEAKAFIEEISLPSAEYAGMIRYFEKKRSHNS